MSRFLHEQGREMISAYDADSMRMNLGIVELVRTHTYLDSAGGSPEVFDEVVAQIALGPGQSVRLVPEEK